MTAPHTASGSCVSSRRYLECTFRLSAARCSGVNVVVCRRRRRRCRKIRTHKFRAFARCYIRCRCTKTYYTSSMWVVPALTQTPTQLSEKLTELEHQLLQAALNYRLNVMTMGAPIVLIDHNRQFAICVRERPGTMKSCDCIQTSYAWRTIIMQSCVNGVVLLAQKPHMSERNVCFCMLCKNFKCDVSCWKDYTWVFIVFVISESPYADMYRMLASASPTSNGFFIVYVSRMQPDARHIFMCVKLQSVLLFDAYLMCTYKHFLKAHMQKSNRKKYILPKAIRSDKMRVPKRMTPLTHTNM